MNQPTAIQRLSKSGCEWKTIVEMITLARQVQKHGSWDDLDIDDGIKQIMKEQFAQADVDPMQIEFK